MHPVNPVKMLYLSSYAPALSDAHWNCGKEVCRWHSWSFILRPQSRCIRWQSWSFILRPQSRCIRFSVIPGCNLVPADGRKIRESLWSGGEWNMGTRPTAS